MESECLFSASWLVEDHPLVLLIIDRFFLAYFQADTRAGETGRLLQRRAQLADENAESRGAGSCGGGPRGLPGVPGH